MNWATITDAIHAWVVSGSGLAAAKVIWAEERAPVPAYPWARIKVLSGFGGGPIVDERRYTTDETATGDEPRLIREIIQRGKIAVSIQIATRRSESALGVPSAYAANSTAAHLIHELRASLGKDSNRAALRAAGLVLRGRGSCVDLTSIVDDEYAERWNLDVEFGAVDTLTENEYDIETAKLNIKVEYADASLQPDEEIVP